MNTDTVVQVADKVPNADTMEAMEELKTGRCKRYDSMEELYRELDPGLDAGACSLYKIQEGFETYQEAGQGHRQT